MPFLHVTLGRKSPLPKGTSPSLHCLTHWGDFVISQRPLLQGKAAVLGACQLNDGLTKSVSRGNTPHPHTHIVAAFSFPFQHTPWDTALYRRPNEGDIHVNIWHCPPGVMYMEAYGAALLLVSKHRKNYAIVTLLTFHMLLNCPCKWIICPHFPPKFFLDIKECFSYVKSSK